MRSTALRLACALLCIVATFARAQDPDAVARAQRDAANPLRMIVEAGKLRPRQKVVEPESAAKAPVEKATLRPVAARPAPATAAAAQEGKAASPASVPSGVAAASAPTEPEPAPVQIEASQPDLARVGPSLQTQAAPTVVAGSPAPTPEDPIASHGAGRSVGAGPPEGDGSATPVATLRSASTMAAPATAPVSSAALQLADYVEPALPDRLRRKLVADAEVVLGFTVNPDGSVEGVAVRSASDKALEAIAVDAVRQWRYQPIAAAQAHAVQLVFKRRE